MGQANERIANPNDRMKASELISALKRAIEECGDLEVWMDTTAGKIEVKEVVRKEKNARRVSHYQYIEIR